jgi:hypothetical protein
VGEKVEAQFAPDMDIEERKRLDLYLSHHGALDASLRNNIKQYGNPAKAVADTDHVELPPEIRALRHPA